MFQLIRRLVSLASVAGDVTVYLRESGEVEVWKRSRSWQLSSCETFYVLPEKAVAVRAIAERLGIQVVVDGA